GEALDEPAGRVVGPVRLGRDGRLAGLAEADLAQEPRAPGVVELALVAAPRLGRVGDAVDARRLARRPTLDVRVWRRLADLVREPVTGVVVAPRLALEQAERVV